LSGAGSAEAQLIPTQTTLTSSPAPSKVGKPVTITANVTASSATPTGNVVFRDGTKVIGTGPLIGASQNAIAAGWWHTCALTSDRRVRCWGDNSSGEVDNDTTVDRLIPTYVKGLSVGVVAVSTGEGESCALTITGGVKCWGGFGPYYSNLPTSGVVAIKAGNDHTCALKSNGGVVCWGNNNTGQLGDNTDVSQLHPVQVKGLTSGVAMIGMGGSHSCAVLTSGGVKCWGAITGDGTNRPRFAPVPVVGLSSGVAALALGGSFTCALTTSGEVRCWGNNSSGQLGDGTTTDRSKPGASVIGLGTGVRAIAAGSTHACALTAAGGVMCWGDNYEGQLGDGAYNNDRPVPRQVRTLTSGVSAIAAGYWHTCAVLNAGNLRCWGNNYSGQLGDNGRTEDRALRPIAVVGGAFSLKGSTGVAMMVTSTLSVGTHSLAARYLASSQHRSSQAPARGHIVNP